MRTIQNTFCFWSQIVSAIAFHNQWFENYIRLISRTWELIRTNTVLSKMYRSLTFKFRQQTIESFLKFDFSETAGMRMHCISIIGFSHSHHWGISETCLLRDETQCRHIHNFDHRIHAIVNLKHSRSLVFIFTHLHHFSNLLSRRWESDQTSIFSEPRIASILEFHMQINL